jgi:hypothetical protein
VLRDRRGRVVPSERDMLDVDRPSLADVRREAGRAYVRGDLERAQVLAQHARRMVLRAQARARAR